MSCWAWAECLIALPGLRYDIILYMHMQPYAIMLHFSIFMMRFVYLDDLKEV